MTQEPAALTLTAGWTDLPVSVVNAGNASAFSGAVTTNTVWTGDTITNQTVHYGWQYGGYWYPYYQPIYPVTTYITTSPDLRPIKLTMAEVERLRVAAKKDKALKATLEKFTAHIEVIVNFGEEK